MLRACLGLPGRRRRLGARRLAGHSRLGLGLGQGRRIGGDRAQIKDHVGEILLLPEPREGHLGARRPALGVGEEMAQLLVIPGVLLLRERIRVAEVGHRGDVAADHAKEMGPDLVGLALAEIVAGGARLGDRLAVLGAAARQERRQADRGRRLAAARSTLAGRAGDLDRVGVLLGHVRAVDDPRDHPGARGDDPRGEDRGQRLVNFERRCHSRQVPS